MPEDAQNQGLQNDGDPLEPSQNLEGNDPDPSQDDTGQLTDQQLQDVLPDQDDRGVSAENVLGEMRRKMDKLIEEISTLKSNQPQPQQFQQPYQQPDYQQQSQQDQRQSEQAIPRSPEEIAKIVDQEVRAKYGEAIRSGTLNDPFEMLTFQNKRTLELNALMSSNLNSVQSERFSSETRIKNVYPDLGNPQSQLAQGVLSELNRRAHTMRMTPQQLYEQDPYVFESIAPMVASRLGINAKAQRQPKIVPKQSNLPPSNFGGKQTVVQNGAKPTENDIEFSKRFGIKPESLVKVREASKNSGTDDNSFIDSSGRLYS